jgi:hypothetical protein
MEQLFLFKLRHTTSKLERLDLHAAKMRARNIKNRRTVIGRRNESVPDVDLSTPRRKPHSEELQPRRRIA